MAAPAGTGRVDVDATRCLGLGLCEGIAPDRFAIQPDGSMRTIDPAVTPAALEAVAETVASCPTQALRLSGEQSLR